MKERLYVSAEIADIIDFNADNDDNMTCLLNGDKALSFGVIRLTSQKKPLASVAVTFIAPLKRILGVISGHEQVNNCQVMVGDTELSLLHGPLTGYDVIKEPTGDFSVTLKFHDVRAGVLNG